MKPTFQRDVYIDYSGAKTRAVPIRPASTHCLARRKVTFPSGSMASPNRRIGHSTSILHMG